LHLSQSPTIDHYQSVGGCPPVPPHRASLPALWPQTFPHFRRPYFLNDADGLNPNLILTDLIVSFQPAGGCILQPAQMERLIINLVVYREALIRNQIQHIGQQILLTFATFPMLDYLGAVRSVTRLAAEPALTTLQFNLTNPLTVSFDVPKGTLVGTSDGLLTFAISADLIIPAVATQGAWQQLARRRE
jgi:Baseplate J-like protein